MIAQVPVRWWRRLGSDTRVQLIGPGGGSIGGVYYSHSEKKWAWYARKWPTDEYEVEDMDGPHYCDIEDAARAALKDYWNIDMECTP